MGETLFVLYALVTLFLSVHAQVAAPVGYLGTNSPPLPPKTGSLAGLPQSSWYQCQAITQISDLQTFGFWIDVNNGSPASVTASVCIYGATNCAYTIAQQPAYPQSGKHATVGGTKWQFFLSNGFGLNNLSPTQKYAICFAGPNTFNMNLAPTATAPSAGQGGAFAYNPSGATTWASSVNLLFTVVTTNLVTLPNPNGNYAQGFGNQAPSGCIWQTTFSAIRVNWNTNQINTGYVGSSTTTLIATNGGSCAATCVPNPYATPSNCAWDWSYAAIDLTGTILSLVSDSWTAYGWGQSGSYSISSGNQVASISVSGYCAVSLTPLAYSQSNGGTIGGLFLNINP